MPAHQALFWELAERLHLTSAPEPKLSSTPQPSKMDLPKRASFLTVPREIRDRIYHYVHSNEEVVFHLWKGSSISPMVGRADRDTDPLSRHVLRVSRQINAEASEVLYRENTFALLIDRIWLRDKLVPVKFNRQMRDRWKHLRGSAPVPIRKMQNLRIEISLITYGEIQRVRDAVRGVVLAIAESPEMRRLTIQLRNHGVSPAEARTLLQPFKMLRHIRHVIFEDPLLLLRMDCTVSPPDYAQYLKGLMEGPMPLEYLPRLYRGLEVFARPPLGLGCYQLDLTEAYETAEAGENEEFKLARRKTIGKVWWSLRSSDLVALFAHDRVRPE